MQNRVRVTLAIVTLLAVSILACAGTSPEPTSTPQSPLETPVPFPTTMPPTPPPVVKEPNYTSASLGLSLWYPEAWIHEEMPEVVAFASSSALMSGDDWETGAAFAVMVAEIETGETIKEMIQQLLEESAFDDVETTELQPVSIGDDRGVMASLDATPMGSSFDVKGFVAGLERNRRVYLFLGISVKEDWPEFGQTLDTMLRSVSFAEAKGTFVSEDLGLKMWYPEDWLIDEEHDQLVFATSSDVIDSGNLESGAALMVRTSSLGDACLEDWFDEELESLTFDEGGPTSDIVPRTIAGEEGLILDLEGVPSGADTSLQGFVAAVAYEEWGYLFLGVTAVDEWTEYSPTLTQMLDSVQFTE